MVTPEEILDLIGAGPWTDSQLYLRMDELRALQLFSRQATRTLAHVDEDNAEWMLVLEAVHAATQVAMAAHLSGSARVGAQTSSAAKRTLNGDWSKERTADFRELIDRIDGTKPRIETEGPPIAIDAQAKQDLHLLNELRCGLVHIMPVGWGVEIEGLPRIALSGAKLVQQVVRNGYIARMADEEEQIALTSFIDRLVTALEERQGKS